MLAVQLCHIQRIVEQRLDEALRPEACEDATDDDLPRECPERGPREEELVDLRLGEEAEASEVRYDLGLTSE